MTEEEALKLNIHGYSAVYLCGFLRAVSEKSPHAVLQSLHVHFLCGLRIVDLNLVDLH